MAKLGWKAITTLIQGNNHRKKKRTKGAPAILSDQNGKGGSPSSGSQEVRMDSQANIPELESPQDLAKRLGIAFQDLLLLSRALTHRSYINEHSEAIEDNERLEFLGDAVLDFVVGAWLYNRYPEMPEGDLTRMRSALVYTDQLANFARKIGLGNAMRLGRGELHGGGRERAPILCDTFEALIGAIYLDQSLPAVIKFMTPLLETASDEVLYTHRIDDPKSMFQEWVQSQGFPAPHYVTHSTSGPDHSKIFEVDAMVNDEVYGVGTGHSKQLATKSAAKDALNRLGLLE
jgi:ribonuclease III